MKITTAIIWFCLILAFTGSSVVCQEHNNSALLPVCREGKCGYIDQTGKIVIPLQFKEARPFSDGLAAVRTNSQDRWGYIDRNGQLVISLNGDFKQVGNFSEGLASFNYSPQFFGFINKSGTVVIKDIFTNAWAFSEGLARVSYDGKYGFIDKTGAFVVDPIFDEAEDFSNGLAHVKIGTRWGYIDKTGKYVWKPSF